MSILVHHAGGARLLVDELVVENLWAPLSEGMPEPAWWDERVRQHAAQAFASAAWVRLVAWDAGAQSDDSARYHQAPRFLCVTRVRVADVDGEHRVAVLAWCENGALAKTTEELVQTCARLPLDRDADAAPTTGEPALDHLRCRDGVGVWLHERFRLRLLVDDDPDRALAHWLSKPHYVLPRDFTSREPPLLACVDLRGGQLPPTSPQSHPHGGTLSALDLAFVAPARGDVTLGALLQEAVGRVVWNRVARPAFSAFD